MKMSRGGEEDDPHKYYSVSRLLSHVFCLLFPVSYLLSHVSSLRSPVSDLLSPVSRPLSQVCSNVPKYPGLFGHNLLLSPQIF